MSEGGVTEDLPKSAADEGLVLVTASLGQTVGDDENDDKNGQEAGNVGQFRDCLGTHQETPSGIDLRKLVRRQGIVDSR